MPTQSNDLALAIFALLSNTKLIRMKDLDEKAGRSPQYRRQLPLLTTPPFSYTQTLVDKGITPLKNLTDIFMQCLCVLDYPNCHDILLASDPIPVLKLFTRRTCTPNLLLAAPDEGYLAAESSMVLYDFFKGSHGSVAFDLRTLAGSSLDNKHHHGYQTSLTDSLSHSFFPTTMGFLQFAGYCGLAALTFLTWVIYRNASAPRYPPGPPKWIPWAGSLAYMPKHNPWEMYEKLGKECNSDIVHLQGAGMNIILLNSEEAAMDLLDKRSAIYSSRPAFSIVETLGWEWLMSNMLYTPAWRERRKLFTKHLHPSKPELVQDKFLSMIRDRLIPNLLKNPEDWVGIFRLAIGSTIISLAYGIPLDSEPSRFTSSPASTTKSDTTNRPTMDSLIQLAEASVKSINTAYAEGAVIVDLVPVLKHFPSWFPGLGFKAKLPEWRKLGADFHNLPFDAEGKAEDSFISACLEEGAESDVEVVKDTAGMMFAGGVDTMLAVIHTFVLAMLLRPETQKRAQQELDQLLATEKRHVIEWEDRDKLPYLTALVREVLRWRPAAPLAVPHASTQDDEYKGYFIPKNSMIIPNAYLMLHDETKYGPRPEEFRPERFLDESGKLKSGMKDPADVAFGFGRRVCPGAHVALYAVFMVAAHILTTFDIESAVDEVVPRLALITALPVLTQELCNTSRAVEEG
ncbi:hypothetical protein NP233_g7365 [Leucocoprinus birnbaumii]|uniref:Cytochrome P450 n=1 Tax=Leucocoprinus birnbaumii TaxID=56174 RepID=A0AAD5VPC8_9AGAR|nr:hypothetical protein NP233_g7365 [Leucocoprinus birnbaumii]